MEQIHLLSSFMWIRTMGNLISQSKDKRGRERTAGAVLPRVQPREEAVIQTYVSNVEW